VDLWWFQPIQILQQASDFRAKIAVEYGLFSNFALIMSKEKENYDFWTKYKRYANTEILLYVIMIVGIILGIIIFS
jgi:hypothetical protein